MCKRKEVNNISEISPKEKWELNYDSDFIFLPQINKFYFLFLLFFFFFFFEFCFIILRNVWLL